ncbi:hypothetical protein BYT27DRAFT_7338877 [Phlegmacium glaucopus]|nr:hypothetical protein BYT27DRAFT_7338877 [Phlegmacium glaucopus]
MQIPPVIELEEAAKRLVWDAVKKGTLKKLTPRLVRQTIETQLGLEERSLDASEYKSAITTATRSALNQDPPPSDEEENQESPAEVNKKRKPDIKHEEDDQPTPKSKGKSSATASKDREDEGSAKKKRKTIKTKKLESEEEAEENNDSEKASPTTTKKKRQKRKDTKQFKSLEHIPTSDMEQDEPGPVNIAGPSITKAVSPKKEKKGSPLRKKVVHSKSSKEAQNPESTPTNNQQIGAPDVVVADTVGRDVSSELTELDEPKPKQKAKAVNKEPKTTKTKEKGKKSARPSTTLSKDEESIKRLKSLVLACGVRKVWSKVFQDLDSPPQQIKKLKEILADLGMTGRMSMEQAKTIKQKRELAQELEDVQQFEKTVLGRSSRSRSQTTAKGAGVEEDDSEVEGSDSEDEGEGEAGPVPKRRPIQESHTDQCKKEYHGFFARSI